MQKHIINRLGLKHTYFASINPPANRSPGHYKSKIVEMPATLAGAAGELIADLDDMPTFIPEWNKGKLFKNPSTMDMVRNDNYLIMSAPILKYGMGTVNLLNVSRGHGGQTFGFQSYIGILTNNCSFVFGIDEASVSGWTPAIKITSLLNTHHQQN